MLCRLDQSRSDSDAVIENYPVEKFYRDVKLCIIGEGKSEIQCLAIARQLLKE